MTVLYVTTNTGFVEVIAVSNNLQKLKEKMFQWCEERNIVPEHYYGDYIFYKPTGMGLGTVNGNLIFKTVKEI